MTESEGNAPQRRRFSRIQFPADVFVEIDDNSINGKLIDISLHGALIEIADSNAVSLNSICRLTLTLTETVKIIMKLKIAHLADNRLGCECTEVDLDSLTHLKRLVAYNIGDQDLLERQLGELIQNPS